EAEWAAAAVSRGGVVGGGFGGLTPAPGRIQRKCAECQKEEEKIRRAPKDGESEAVPAEARAEPGQGQPEPAAAEAESGPAKAAPALLVDDTEEAGEGQMRKGEFMTALRESVCAAADEAMAATGSNTQGCPFVDYWFAYYEDKDAVHVERALR